MSGVRIRRIVIQTMSFAGEWEDKTTVPLKALAADTDCFGDQQGDRDQVGQQGAAG